MTLSLSSELCAFIREVCEGDDRTAVQQLARIQHDYPDCAHLILLDTVARIVDAATPKVTT